MEKLHFQAWGSIVLLVAIMAGVIFGAAGTIHYQEAWVFLILFTIASVLTTHDLIKRDPALLRRRLRGGPTAEKERSQQVIMLFASLGFLALIVVPALDFRFGWSEVPTLFVIIGDILLLVGFFLVDRVYRANTYASATIEIVKDQVVISTGPYGIVRHPMYASALLYVVGIPLALGSYWGLVGVAILLPALIWRLLDEERLLARDLPGYSDYMKQVKHRLIPFIW